LRPSSLPLALLILLTLLAVHLNGLNNRSFSSPFGRNFRQIFATGFFINFGSRTVLSSTRVGWLDRTLSIQHLTVVVGGVMLRISPFTFFRMPIENLPSAFFFRPPPNPLQSSGDRVFFAAVLAIDHFFCNFLRLVTTLVPSLRPPFFVQRLSLNMYSSPSILPPKLGMAAAPPGWFPFPSKTLCTSDPV